jgi:Tol biopolymer transport system component/N-acetylneuraminic acid mutarotase
MKPSIFLTLAFTVVSNLACATSAQMTFQKEIKDQRLIVVADFDGKNQKIISDSKLDTYHPDISSSGQYIAFSQGTIQQGGNTQLEIIIKDLKNDITEVWSPKGNQFIHVEFSGNDNILAFSGPNPKTNKQNIYIVDLDKERKMGSKKIETKNGKKTIHYQPAYNIIDSTYDCYAPAVSSDGSLIIYHRTQNKNDKKAPKQLIAYNTLTKTEFELTDKNKHAMFPSISANDRFVAYVSQDSGQWDIYVYDLWTKNIKQLTNDAEMEFTPSFRNNDEIYFTRFTENKNSKNNTTEIQIDIYFLPAEALTSNQLISPKVFLNDANAAEYVPSFSNSLSLTKHNLPSFPKPERSSFGAITHNNKVYIAGGHQGPEHTYPKESFLDLFQVYDLDKKIWSNLSPMPLPKHGFQMAAFKNYIYVFGGFTYSDQHQPKWKSVDTIERYNILTNTWSTLTNKLPRSRSSNALAVVNNLAYLIGGWDSTPRFKDDKSGKFHSEIDTFDFLNEKVNTIPQNLPSPLRRALTAVSMNNSIYLLGGIGEGTSHFEWVNNLIEFNPQTGLWKELSPLPFATFAPGAGVINDNIYLVGGMILKDPKTYDMDYVDDIYAYNLNTKQWTHTGVFLNENKGFPQVVPLTDSSLGILGGHTYMQTPDGVLDHPVNSFETITQ